MGRRDHTRRVVRDLSIHSVIASCRENVDSFKPTACCQPGDPRAVMSCRDHGEARRIHLFFAVLHRMKTVFDVY